VGDLLDHLFETCGISPDDIDLVVPHQASGPALAAIPRYGLAEEKVMNIVGEYGNCVAASMPMALHLALEEGRIKSGDKVLMLGTGAGLSVAAALLRW
jgi:3-oxoacyl-[acyl-carrier-protein] synthase-3